VVGSVVGLRSVGQVLLATCRFDFDRDFLWAGCLPSGFSSVRDDWKSGRSLWRDFNVAVGSRRDWNVGSDSCGVSDRLKSTLHWPLGAASRTDWFVDTRHVTRRSEVSA
jgi:hypothetical protein